MEAFQEGFELTDSSGALLWWFWYRVATLGSARRPTLPERPLAMLLLLLMGLQADALLIGEGGGCSRLRTGTLLVLLVLSNCLTDLAVRPATLVGACCCCCCRVRAALKACSLTPCRITGCCCLGV
jgi:hypothetical protein